MRRVKYETRARQLADEFQELDQQVKDAQDAAAIAETNRKAAELGTRQRDRSVMLLWMGGDRSVYEKVREVRRESAQCERHLAKVARCRAEKDRELREHITEGMKQHDGPYRAVLAERDNARLGVGTCSATLHAIADTHRLIASGSSAGSVDSRNEAARLAVDQNAFDIWNCVQNVCALVDEVNKKAAKSYGRVSGRAIRGLNLSFSGNSGDRRQRIRELNAAAKAVDDVAAEVNLIRMAFEERVKVLDEDLLRMLLAERERFRQALS
jgi:hypothetical protein